MKRPVRPVFMPPPGRGQQRAGADSVQKQLGLPEASPAPLVDKPGSRPSFLRRKYLVYPKFQLLLILMNMLIMIVMFGFLAIQVVQSHLSLEGLVKATHLPAQNVFSQMLNIQLRGLLINLGLALLVSLVITAITTLLVSHRLAGPIIRLRKVFSEIGKQGEFPDPVRFRKGDYFEDLPPIINQAFLALRKRWYR